MFCRFSKLFLLMSCFYFPVSMADSCWSHNGSIMRLVASGNQRWFYYESPKALLREAGVSSGTLLFNGRKQGDDYIGTARRFSKYCPNTPLEYHVEGHVMSNPLQIIIRGSRPIYKQCVPTGRYADDTLIFKYIRNC